MEFSAEDEELLPAGAAEPEQAVPQGGQPQCPSPCLLQCVCVGSPFLMAVHHAAQYGLRWEGWSQAPQRRCGFRLSCLAVVGAFEV